MNYAAIPPKTQEFIWDRVKQCWKTDSPRTGQSSTLRMQIVSICNIPGWQKRGETAKDMPAPPEDATFLNYEYRLQWNRTSTKEWRRWVVGYFSRAHLDSCFPQLLEMAGAVNLPQPQQAIKIERWLWMNHRDEIRAASDRQQHYCKVIDRYRISCLF